MSVIRSTWGPVGLVLCAAAVILAFVPLLPCPRRCWEPAPDLVRYSALPGVSQEKARRILAWWASFPCSDCGSRRRVSLVDRLADVRWGLLSSQR